MTPLPLPPPTVVASRRQGFGRAAQIRVLYAERCSIAEIAAALSVEVAEVRRTLQRPVRAPDLSHRIPPPFNPAEPRDRRGRWTRA